MFYIFKQSYVRWLFSTLKPLLTKQNKLARLALLTNVEFTSEYKKMITKYFANNKG